MENVETKDYLLRLLDKNNKEELIEVQRLRYIYLLKDFDESLPEEGLDDDGFDEFSDSLIVVHKATNRIIGTYRITTKETSQGKPFKTETEFDISSILAAPEGVAETGRAVIHVDHRNGVVLGMIWKGIFNYAKWKNCRYVIGTCSLHGVDPTIHYHCLAYIKNKCLDTRFNVKAVENSFEYPDDPSVVSLDNNMPSLLKGYLVLGAKISLNGFIDYEFKSCDVLIIIDLNNLNERLLNMMLRF